MSVVCPYIDKAVAYIESGFDTSKMTKHVQDDDNGEYLSCFWAYDYVPENSDLPTEITIGGSKIVIGETLVKDLEGRGFEILNRDAIADPNDILGILLSKDGNEFMLDTVNYGDAPISVLELPVLGFSDSGVEFNPPFTYGELTEQLTPEALVAALGATYSDIMARTDLDGSYIDVHYWSSLTRKNTSTST